MAEGQGAVLRRLGLEFLVVVVGILAALAVGDWTEARRDRALEQHLLASLIADLEADRRDAELQAKLMEGHRNAVEHVLFLTGHPAASASQTFSAAPSEIDAALTVLLDYAELQVFDPTYAEMISTGSIRVIRDPALRREISTYYQAAEVLLAIPLRLVDPRPELQSALAGAGIAPGESSQMSDLVGRLRSDPMIATHALRIRQYYSSSFVLDAMNEQRESLVQAVQSELESSQ